MIEKERTTKETSVSLRLDVDGGDRRIEIPCGFLRHMLELFAFHAGIGLDVTATGDVDVDCHHVTEDIGILLGKAFEQARSGRNIQRYGYALFPWTALLCWPPSISAAGGSSNGRGRSLPSSAATSTLSFCPSSGARSAAKEGSRSTRRPSPATTHTILQRRSSGSGQGVPAGPLSRRRAAKHEGNARMIGVVDYQVGNTGNVRRAFERIGEQVCLLHSPDELGDRVSVAVLPGSRGIRTGFGTTRSLGVAGNTSIVGAFRAAAARHLPRDAASVRKGA